MVSAVKGLLLVNEKPESELQQLYAGTPLISTSIVPALASALLPGALRCSTGDDSRIHNCRHALQPASLRTSSLRYSQLTSPAKQLPRR
jgi:hypothetical protein